MLEISIASLSPSQIESEDKTAESNDSIVHPYNPADVRITSRLMNLDLLFSRMRHGEIDMNTSFQRKDGLWNLTQQSRLIESVLIRFPLPTFYFDGSDENKWQIVDGLQRLTTFKNFVIEKEGSKMLKLQGLEFLSQLDRKCYDELPRDLQRRISETEVPVYIINPGTPLMVKYSIFERINTGGLILKPQEIRHAINQGIPADFVKDLADSQAFRKATAYAVPTDRMEDRDFVTRFIAFYTKPIEEYEAELDKFLNLAMSELKDLSEDERESIKNQFIKAMELAIAIFGDDAFRKRLDPNDGRNPINKALFETWSVSLAKLSDEEGLRIVEQQAQVKRDFMEKLRIDSQFHKSITAGTGDIRNIKKRFNVIHQIIQQSLL